VYPGAHLTPNTKFEDGDPDIEFFDNARGQWKPARAWFGTLVENCLSRNTQVLTVSGWKFITDIERTELIFDSIEWVTDDGVVLRGMRETAPLDGVRMTADHKVLTHERGWVAAASAQGLHRVAVRLPDSGSGCGFNRSARYKQARRAASVVATMRLRADN